MHVRVIRRLKQLKRDFPLKHSVQVEVLNKLEQNKKPLYGAMLFYTPPQYKIWLLNHTDVSVQIETLWHEWTHCLLWPRCKYRHSKLFWATYGKIYSHYQDEQ